VGLQDVPGEKTFREWGETGCPTSTFGRSGISEKEIDTLSDVRWGRERDERGGNGLCRENDRGGGGGVGGCF